VSVSELKDGDCEEIVFAELQEFSAEGFPAHNIIINLAMMYPLLLALMKNMAINIHNIISKNKVDEEGEV